MGVTGAVCGAPDTIAIPADPLPPLNAAQIAGVFTIYNGTFTMISGYAPTGDLSAGQNSIKVDFTTAGGTVILAWGGHISSSTEWAPETTAVTIAGSPYHMRLLDASEGTGNQDLALSANAIILPDPTITIIKVLSPDTGLFNLRIDGSIAGWCVGRWQWRHHRSYHSNA